MNCLLRSPGETSCFHFCALYAAVWIAIIHDSLSKNIYPKTVGCLITKQLAKVSIVVTNTPC